ncbi:MAG TPA: dienelactone hydrolase family protein [Polyangia bacterium]|jgi:carboxymethylenebutenolidase|nr:dienelactone hydrolase family protein [Polyangia bacterium]
MRSTGKTAAVPRDSAERPSRRQVIVTALGSGFALAVLPVSAATISTSDEGIEAGEIKIPVGAESIPGYRAMPGKGTAKSKGKGFPVVMVVQEIFGVHEHIKDVCRRFAKQGYLAVAPALYARQGDVSTMTDSKEIMAKVVSKVPDQQVMGDLDATVAWAKTSGEADVSRLAINGFCWGGRIVWLYSAHNPHLRAGVAWYGRIVGNKDPLHPQNPLDIAAAVKAPVLGLYGAQDQGIPVATVEQMQKALAAAHSKAARACEFKIYPDAGHAFFADYRPSYRQDAAEDGWTRALAFLKKNGVG